MHIGIQNTDVTNLHATWTVVWDLLVEGGVC